MEPRDAVKLAYQSEFAGGHLIRDRRESLARLKTELAGVRQRPGAPLAETIGGGLVRVHLAALAEHGITPEQLNGWFADTAQRSRGSLEGLLQRLDVLRALAREGRLPFGRAAAERYLMDYAAQGYPPLSHSQAYRAAYRPGPGPGTNASWNSLPVHSGGSSLRPRGAGAAGAWTVRRRPPSDRRHS